MHTKKPIFKDLEQIQRVNGCIASIKSVGFGCVKNRTLLYAHLGEEPKEIHRNYELNRSEEFVGVRKALAKEELFRLVHSESAPEPHASSRGVPQKEWQGWRGRSVARVQQGGWPGVLHDGHGGDAAGPRLRQRPAGGHRPPAPRRDGDEAALTPCRGVG